MKKVLVLLAVACICVFLGAVQDEQPAAKKKPHVFITTNSCSSYINCHATNGGYSKFAKNARESGFTIEHGQIMDITDELLESVDIFILATPPFSLDDEDKKALRRFLRRGGSLLVLTYIHDEWDGFSNLDGFLVDYGITFGKFGGFHSYTANVIPDSPLSGPEPCEIIYNPYTVSFLQLDKKSAQVVARTDNGEILAAISLHKNLGKGRMVVVGADHMFYDNYIGKYDNEAFKTNILYYLYGGCDLKMLKTKFRGKNLSPGDDVTLIARVKNIGNLESAETVVEFILSDDGEFTARPAASVATLATVDLPPLAAGKAKKIKTKVAIPDSLEPGEYFLFAIADPEGTGNDSNPDNNIKMGKKKLIIK